ncbi:MAG: hypothetical protein FD124_1182 [Alphaproteobacteria bacterium]|nr:MAG: hypothetical protein FD160_1303 [Caulobacteraceae bacterium]TPW07346.1 MAG: hypothetical protein FD124_1182 [Alphaproteobacteria bacterium]
MSISFRVANFAHTGRACCVPMASGFVRPPAIDRLDAHHFHRRRSTQTLALMAIAIQRALQRPAVGEGIVRGAVRMSGASARDRQAASPEESNQNCPKRPGQAAFGELRLRSIIALRSATVPPFRARRIKIQSPASALRSSREAISHQSLAPPPRDSRSHQCIARPFGSCSRHVEFWFAWTSNCSAISASSFRRVFPRELPSS